MIEKSARFLEESGVRQGYGDIPHFFEHIMLWQARLLLAFGLV